ncbi:kinase-like domain-containing protein [Helicostylum pulchrum]|uniref:Choline kinase n=1 Tax=Helicostylum pulchrum TaxID=562976 RepID=A0ABP9XZK1_9FUNG|nr:kinase-like domain-containing protein [Helicostylum pulchrum]
MTTKTESSSRPGLSTLLKNKIGKLRASTRSKSSPALLKIDSNIQESLVTIVNKKPKQHNKQVKIPHCQQVIDLSVLKGDEFKRSVQLLISTLFLDWVSPKSLDQDLSVDRVSGALTNAVFFVTVGRKRMLLRVYGAGCDQILDRKKELDWLSRLSELNIGPKLLGIFGNGRFEEYLPSTTLTRSDIREASVSKQIASRLYQLHSIVELYPPSTTDKLEVWKNIDQWYLALSTELIPKLLAINHNWKDQIENHLNLVKLRNDIELCKIILGKNNSPTVFAHNDTQYGNILKINGTNELVVIDFEYAGYNPRGFDIVNHFCEWMYDYHSSNPAMLHLDQYPTREQQASFISSYYSNDVDSLLKEVNDWKMACHLFWALWGLIQASQSEIDFDYFYYSMQRITAFRKELDNRLIS